MTVDKFKANLWIQIFFGNCLYVLELKKKLNNNITILDHYFQYCRYIGNFNIVNLFEMFNFLVLASSLN